MDENNVPRIVQPHELIGEPAKRSKPPYVSRAERRDMRLAKCAARLHKLVHAVSDKRPGARATTMFDAEELAEALADHLEPDEE